MRRVRRGPILVLVIVAIVVAVVFQQNEHSTESRAAASATELDDPGLPSADALSASWFCTEGTSTPDGRADETIIVSSVADREVTATVTVMPGGSDAPVSRTLHIDAHREARLRVADVLATAEPGVVVEVTGGQAAVAHQIANSESGDVATEPCSRRAGTDWYFAAGTTVRGSQHYLTLFNPFGDDAVVDVSIVTDAGVQEPDALQALVVPRRSRITRAVHELVPRQGVVAAHVHARVGRVVAERTMIFDGTTPDDAPARRGISLSLGAAAPGRTWNLPFGTNIDGAQSLLGVANFGARPSTIEVAVVLDGDVDLTPMSVSVPPRSAITVDVGAQVPARSSYTVQATARSVEGHAPPLVVEMLGWWPDASSSTGVATAMGATHAARRWVVALPGNDGDGVVSVLNTSGEPITAEVRSYSRSGGAPSSAPAASIAAGRFATFSLGALNATRDQVIVVVADQPVVVGLTVTGDSGATWMVAIPDFSDGAPAQMAIRIVIAVVLAIAVGVVAWSLRRRPPEAPPRDVYPVPRQLDRADFDRRDAPWLVALFSSAACDSCRTLPAKISVLEAPEVATCDITAEARGDLHRRYEISAVPTTVIADADGVVQRSFVGSFTATDLWAALAELRTPGSTPEPDLGLLD